jgi:molybdate transport system substrate-binding protein
MLRRTGRTGSRHAAVAVLLAGALGACSGLGPDRPDIGPPDAPPGTTAAPPGPSGAVSVQAAPVLTEVLTELADRFEQANEEAEVRTTFASAAQLVTQLDASAVDVIVVDDPGVLDALVGSGTLLAPVELVTVPLEIAVPSGNPSGIAGLVDLTRPGLTVALCAPEAPCGRLADGALTAAGVSLAAPRREVDVKAAVAAVAAGEADAAIVYRSDVLAAAVDGVTIAGIAPATIAAAVVANGPNRAAADAFLAFLREPDTTQVFTDFGFAGLP